MPKEFFSPSPCAGFIVANRAALACAAHLLGGPAASKRVQRLIDELSLCAAIDPAVEPGTGRARRPAGLRHVNDFDRVGAARFNRIDPLDPAVEEICELIDRLRDARAAEAHEG
ncbi:hypothetical protein MALG_03373 [Marinovum algicola DG 898]|nr:hypothetical protein MALG_03373 [Marinovum algicola DG 898]